jgi:TPR repeat protein
MISEAKPAFSLLMIDACRDNPLKARGRSVGNARGLSAIEPPKGQIVMYSASRGQQALDRLSGTDTNPNSVFTREFIARMKKPGIKIEDLMKEVQDSVETLAKSINHEQRPAIYNEARGNFYFFGPTTVQTSPPPPVSNEQQKEEKFWEDVKLAGNKEAYEAYLQRYPTGIYAYLAKANILRLSDVSKPAFNQPPSPDTNPAETKSIGDAETQKLFREATIQKDAKAQYNLGNRYFNGTGGLTKDLIQAEYFYRLAADQGESYAQVSLGDFYRLGLGGLNKDFSESIKLYELSAKQGNAKAQDILGWLYAYGQAGLKKDDVIAERLFRLSSNQGNFNAQYNLGTFYLYGRGGLPKDEIQAEKLFRLAANQGNPNGHVMLGDFYRDG